MEIIGLSGFARVGKDEVAQILVNEYGFKRVAFADKLRDVLYALNPVIIHDPDQRRKDFEKPYRFLQDIIDEFGWNGYKETVWGSEIRRLLQRLGTEAGRQTLWDSIWIDAAFTGVDSEKIVVTDARFFNEFDAVRERGGSIWRIERPGVGPLNDHASEMEAVDYPHFEIVLNNDGSLEDLKRKVGLYYEGRI